MTLAMLGPISGGAAETAAVSPRGAKETSRVALPTDFLEYLATLEGTDENWTDFEAALERARVDGTKAAAPRAAKAVESK